MKKVKMVLVLAVAVLSFGLTGCRNDSEHLSNEHPSSEHPAGEESANEHPSGEHPK